MKLQGVQTYIVWFSSSSRASILEDLRPYSFVGMKVDKKMDLTPPKKLAHEEGIFQNHVRRITFVTSTPHCTPKTWHGSMVNIIREGGGGGVQHRKQCSETMWEIKKKILFPLSSLYDLLSVLVCHKKNNTFLYQVII